MTPEMITSDPNVTMGKPVIAGTRVTLGLILEKLAAGELEEADERCDIPRLLDRCPSIQRSVSPTSMIDFPELGQLLLQVKRT